MSTRAVCPNDSEHSRFFAGATVRETWVVDECGKYIMGTAVGVEVLSRPNLDDSWTCTECGVEAELEQEESKP